MKRIVAVMAIGFSVLAFGSLATAIGSGVTYQGRILKPSGAPLSGQFTQFKLQIRTPDSAGCLMYEEIQSQDLRNSGGLFSLTINDGTGSRTDTTGLALDRIFANRGMFSLDASTCSIGSGVYSPNVGDGRSLVVQFKDETMTTWEPIPPQRINFVPLAFEAKQVQGFTADSLLRVVNGSGDPLTGLAPLSNAQYTALMDLVNGSSTQYTRAGQLNGVALPTMNSGEVLGWNGSAWVSQAASGGANSVTTTMIQNGAVDGTKLDPAISISTSGTIASAITTTRDFKIYAASPSTFYVGMLADPALAASYTLTWPLTKGTNGQVLTSDGAGKLTWISPSSAGITDLTGDVTATGPGSAAATVVSVGGSAAADVHSAELLANAATSANTPNAIVKRDGSGNFLAGAISAGSVSSSGPVTGTNITASGVLTAATVKADTLQLNNAGSVVNVVNPMGAAYTLTLPANTGTNGQVLTTDGSGVTSWTTALTGSTGFVQGGNSFGANADLGTNDAYDLNLRTNGATKMTVTSGGNVGIGTASPVAKLDVVGSLRVGDGGETCDASHTGAIRYNGGNLQFCAGSMPWTTLGVAGSGISSLTGDVTATGPGAAAATVASVGGSTAALVHSAELLANAATDANTASTIVKRDASGNFSAGAISATSVTATGAVTQGSSVFKDSGSNTVTIQAPTSVTSSYILRWPASVGGSGDILSTDASGNMSWASMPTALPPNGSAGGDLSGSYPNPGVATVGTSTAANIHSAELLANAATAANTSSAIVKRDGSGNFTANVATLNGLALNNGGSIFNLVNPIGGAWTMTVPATAGSNGQTMVTNGSGLMSWVTPVTTSTGFLNGGNSFAANANLGTNDAYDLNLRTGGTTKMTVTSAGNVGVGTSAPTEKLEVTGGVKIGNTIGTSAGTLRWTGTNFQAYNGAAWQNLVVDLPVSGGCDQTQIYNSPGVHAYTVPASFGTITVKVWGGGGPGGYYFGIGGTGGGTSTVTSLGLGAGGGGPGGIDNAGGTGGTASGGTTVITGNTGNVGVAGVISGSGASAPNGGGGGAGSSSGYGTDGSVPGGGGGGGNPGSGKTPGGGGSGGYTEKTFTPATLPPGTTINDIVVGAGGVYGGVAGHTARGGAGGSGQVSIICSSTGSPPANNRGLLFLDSGAYSSDSNLVYDSSGNVGIGTSSPASKLHVAAVPATSADYGLLSLGSGAFDGSTVGHFVGSANGSAIAVNIASVFTGSLIDLQVSGSRKFRVDNVGNVTMGGAIEANNYISSQVYYGAPYAPTSVTSNTPGGSTITSLNNSISYNGSYSGFRAASGNTDGNRQYVYFGSLSTGGAGAYNPAIVLGAQTGATSYSERMRIDNSGNIGIGTTSPQATLDVNGAVRLKINSTQPVACSSANSGTVALNSSFRFCVCNGVMGAWVYTTDGATACAW